MSEERIIGLQTDNEVAHLLEVPIGQLLYILYQKEDKYKSFSVLKRSGKSRLIESPCSSIRIMQNKVRPLIEACYRVKKPVHGFVGGGKGIVTNAEQHKKKAFVLNLDLSNFFHSVNFGRVRGIFMSKPFDMGESAATVMAQLCTYNGRLPQGASTSPVLSNLASASLDKRLVKLAKKNSLTYTRYADDITFSSNTPFPASFVKKDTQKAESGQTHEVGELLNQVIQDSGFHVNPNKTRLQHRSQKQEVTGLIVNEGVNINRKFIRNTRAMIHDWVTDLHEAEVRFIKQRYHANEASIDRSKLDGGVFKRAIYGRLSFIRMVKGEEHSPYLNLCKKVLELDSSPPRFISKLKEVFDMYDVFICHASEEKEDVVLPIHQALEEKGVKVFVDCFEIRWGDSLIAKINTALRKSKYVLAVISENSVTKAWPMKELNVVLSTEINSEETKLLPLIVGNEVELVKKIPLLADKVFVNYEGNPDEVADKIHSLF